MKSVISSAFIMGRRTILAVPPPSISPNGQTSASSMTVTLACSLAGATIKYTLDGTNPLTSLTAHVYSSPITILTSCTLRTGASKTGYIDSNVVTSNPFVMTSFTDPTSIANLLIWYDASDANTITQSGGFASQWNDKSGNGNHAKQTTAAIRPVLTANGQNGLNVMHFNTANTQYMTLTTTIAPANATVIAVMSSDHSFQSGITGFSDTASPNFVPYWTNFLLNGPGIEITGAVIFGESGFSGEFESANGGGFHVVGADKISSTITYNIYLDGTLPDALTQPLFGTRTDTMSVIGARVNEGVWSAGSIAEIALYSGVLSTNNRHLLESYLRNKRATP
jgi:hypothetical protein